MEIIHLDNNLFSDILRNNVLYRDDDSIRERIDNIYRKSLGIINKLMNQFVQNLLKFNELSVNISSFANNPSLVVDLYLKISRDSLLRIGSIQYDNKQRRYTLIIDLENMKRIDSIINFVKLFLTLFSSYTIRKSIACDFQLRYVDKNQHVSTNFTLPLRYEGSLHEIDYIIKGLKFLTYISSKKYFSESSLKKLNEILDESVINNKERKDELIINYFYNEDVHLFFEDENFIEELTRITTEQIVKLCNSNVINNQFSQQYRLIYDGFSHMISGYHDIFSCSRFNETDFDRIDIYINYEKAELTLYDLYSDKLSDISKDSKLRQFSSHVKDIILEFLSRYNSLNFVILKNILYHRIMTISDADTQDFMIRLKLIVDNPFKKRILEDKYAHNHTNGTEYNGKISQAKDISLVIEIESDDKKKTLLSMDYRISDDDNDNIILRTILEGDFEIEKSSRSYTDFKYILSSLDHDLYRKIYHYEGHFLIKSIELIKYVDESKNDLYIDIKKPNILKDYSSVVNQRVKNSLYQECIIKNTYDEVISDTGKELFSSYVNNLREVIILSKENVDKPINITHQIMNVKIKKDLFVYDGDIENFKKNNIRLEIFHMFNEHITTAIQRRNEKSKNNDMSRDIIKIDNVYKNYRLDHKLFNVFIYRDTNQIPFTSLINLTVKDNFRKKRTDISERGHIIFQFKF